MKKVISICLLLFCSSSIYAQSDFTIKKGIIVNTNSTNNKTYSLEFKLDGQNKVLISINGAAFVKVDDDDLDENIIIAQIFTLLPSADPVKGDLETFRLKNGGTIDKMISNMLARQGKVKIVFNDSLFSKIKLNRYIPIVQKDTIINKRAVYDKIKLKNPSFNVNFEAYKPVLVYNDKSQKIALSRADTFSHNSRRDTITGISYDELSANDVDDEGNKLVHFSFTIIDQIRIESAKIYIQDGYIYNIGLELDTADTKKYNFCPSQAYYVRWNLRHNIATPSFLEDVDILQFQTRKDSTIHFGLKEKGFRLADVINYKAPENATGIIFTAQDTVLNFNTDEDFLTPKAIKEKSLYSIINLDLFTDLVGIFGKEQPNGLLQAELRINFYGLRWPALGYSPNARVKFTFLNKGEVFFRVSKLDNRDRFLPLFSSRQNQNSTDTIFKYAHGINLFRYQNIYTGVKMNIGELEYTGGSLSLFTELSYIRTPIKDSMVTIKDGNTVITPDDYGYNSLVISPGVNLFLYRSSFLEIHFEGRYIYLKPLTNFLSLSKSEFDGFYGQNNLKSAKSTNIINPRAIINIKLNASNTRRIMIRLESYFEKGISGNNYWNAQVGYSADLDKFLNLKRVDRN